jgi:YebC/PmpR family DNA-binding regulatory protein
MSGHNRWSKIKHQKAAMGATKGALFSKLIREITTAARMGGGEPDNNVRLRTALLLAREANMGQESILRAVKKGTGELEGVSYEELVYEGYGPGGVALVVEVLTDNKNRSASDVRNLFSKAGGSLAATGAVAFQFDRRGVVFVKPGPQGLPAEEQVLELALDAGADDVIAEGHGQDAGFEIRCDPSRTAAVHKALEAKLAVAAPRVVYVPKTPVPVAGEVAQRVLRLVDALEEHEDVQRVHGNFELDEATLAALDA